ncbi:MAG: serine protease, partial [Planctomycetota bacterium]
GEVRDCAGCGKQHVNNVATGFAISSDGIIVTNYHVVASIDPEFRVVASTSDGKTYPVTEVVAANQNDDLAAIRIAGSSFRALPLSENNATGTRIAIISQPSRNQFYLSEGIVSRHYLEHVDASTPSRHIMGVSAEFAIGSSGGPVIDLQGNAIGVVAATADLDGQMVLRTCVPAQRIMSLFNPAAKPTEPKRDDPLALERACLRATHAAFVALMQKQEDLTPEEFSKRFQDLHASMLAAIKLCPNDPIATGYLKAMQRDTLQK